MKREDYLIGLRKYNNGNGGDNASIVRGLLPDIACVLALLMMKRYLVQVGVWDYVRVEGNIYLTPSFKRDLEDL